MSAICDCRVKISRRFFIVCLVAAFLGPIFNHAPFYLKIPISADFIFQESLKPRDTDKLFRVVLVTFINSLLVRKVIALGLFRNTGFQRALHRVTTEIIGSRVMGLVKQRSGFL